MLYRSGTYSDGQDPFYAAAWSAAAEGHGKVDTANFADVPIKQ